MIHLERLELEAFRSFVDHTTILFPRDGLILINGKNLQTQDASGTGKSSIFLGIAYALNILPTGVVGSNLQSFLTKKKMQVRVVLHDSGQGYIAINRGKETDITYGGHTYEGAALVNEHIEKVFGLTSEMLHTLAYRPQRSDGLFLTKNDTEKKEFLSALLGLDKIEKGVDNASETVKTLTKDLASIEAQIKSKKEVLAQIKLVDITAIEAENLSLTTEISDHQIEKERYEKKYEEDMVKDAEINKAIDEKYSKLREQGKALLKAHQASDVALQASTEYNNGHIRNYIAKEQLRLAAIQAKKIELSDLTGQACDLQENKCYTCNRYWDEAGTKLTEAYERIKDLEHAISMEPAILDAISALNAKIKTHTPDTKIPALIDALADINKQQEHERPIGYGTGAINMMLQHERKIHELSEILLKNKVVIEKQRELRGLHTSISKEVGLLDAQKVNKEAKLQAEADFIKVLGKDGFLGSIFDEVLAEIVQVINNKLSNVANMSAVTFDFKTEVLNSKGISTKKIVPMVTMFGHESKISALSGGMMSSLELITDLAVKEVIERRTGKEIGFYFTDEAFNGQGQPTKEACLEILKQDSTRKAFFVIDHHSEFKELFSQVIDIEMENGQSKVK